jgi:predicted AlkP superfamily pyrophosphatase or phosphodiesterase
MEKVLLKRVSGIVVVAFLIAGAAAYALRPGPVVPEGAPTETAMARSIGTPVMEHLYRGHYPGRSGDISMVAKPYSYVIGDWDVRTLGSDTPTTTTTHGNPWDYLTRVPIIVRGGPLEGIGQDIYDEVDIADLAPTYAQMIGMDDFEADGEPLPGFPAPSKKPKLIFTVVIDGGGWNVLQAQPKSWPVLDGLRRDGTTYVNATIGSAPSITAALHATFGTGSYPKETGMPGHVVRADDGELADIYLSEADPRYLRLPALAELWDEANDNEAEVGTVAFEDWHLGMIGHGAYRDGGDKDIAVLWEREEEEWWVNEDYYTLPSYLQTTDITSLESYEDQLDGRDGVIDGLWFGRTLEQLRERTVRPGTPAFTRFTGDAVIDVLRNEDFGVDDITDMLWVEMKMPDYAGHSWTMSGPEQADVLFEVDKQIGRMIDELDRTVGKDDYVLVVTADHGQQPLADLRGGWRISATEVRRDIEERFGPVIEKVTPADIFLDYDAMEEAGHTAEDIARYLGAYTIADNIPEDLPGAERVPEARLGERVFAGVFTTGFLGGLDAGTIDSYGNGDYPEGDFVVTREPGAAAGDQ